MPLGTEVGLGSGDIALDGDPHRKGHSSPPLFGPHIVALLSEEDRAMTTGNRYRTENFV